MHIARAHARTRTCTGHTNAPPSNKGRHRPNWALEGRRNLSEAGHEYLTSIILFSGGCPKCVRSCMTMPFHKLSSFLVDKLGQSLSRCQVGTVPFAMPSWDSAFLVNPGLLNTRQGLGQPMIHLPDLVAHISLTRAAQAPCV
eukprot:1784786-Pleurochrysis_carterae.AAC.2